MHPKPHPPPSALAERPPEATALDGPAPQTSARARAVVVRRGTQGPCETLTVPEGCSPLRVGMQHLAQTRSPDLVDEWFVIEE